MMNEEKEKHFLSIGENPPDKKINLREQLEKDRKLFLAYWGDGFQDPATVCYMEEDDFEERLGYTPKQIEKIQELKFGESCVIGRSTHIVTRVV